MDSDEVLRALKVVLSSVTSTGELVPAEWKKEVEILRGLSFEDDNPLDPLAVSNTTALSQASALVSRLTPVSEALRIIADSFQDELAMAHRCLQSLKPMCCLASVMIPNDIMLLIFELVVDRDGPNNLHRACTTLRLSHVSRHFRKLVLSAPQLWNQINVHPKCSDKLVDACIRWSQDAPLDVHLSVCVSTPERGPYLDALRQVLSEAHRWRNVTFHVIHDHSRSTWSRRQQVGGAVQPIFKRRLRENGLPEGNFSAPSLQELSIKHEFRIPSSEVEILLSEFSWHTPDLRSLKVFRHFPLNLPALSLITTLDLIIDHYDFDFRQFLDALSRMRGLEDFSVGFDKFDDPNSGPNVVFDPIIVENVTRFSFQIQTGYLFTSQTSPQRALYAALFFPNATDLHVQFHGLKEDPHRTETSIFTNNFLRCTGEQFPRLSSLHFGLQVRGRNNPYHWVTKEGAVSLVPLHHLRSLERLTIQGDFPFYIDISIDRPLPALQRISLLFPKIEDRANSKIRQWVVDYVHRLQFQGDWERFVELVVRETTYSTGLVTTALDFAEITVPRDRVLDWCNSKEFDYSDCSHLVYLQA